MSRWRHNIDSLTSTPLTVGETALLCCLNCESLTLRSTSTHPFWNHVVYIWRTRWNDVDLDGGCVCAARVISWVVVGVQVGVCRSFEFKPGVFVFHWDLSIHRPSQLDALSKNGHLHALNGRLCAMLSEMLRNWTGTTVLRIRNSWLLYYSWFCGYECLPPVRLESLYTLL